MDTYNVWCTRLFDIYEVEAEAIAEWLNDLEHDEGTAKIKTETIVPVGPHGSVLVIVCVETKR